MGILLSCYPFFFYGYKWPREEKEEVWVHGGRNSGNKLREIGEWVTAKTDGGFRSNGTFFSYKFKYLFNIFKVNEMREPYPFMSSINVILDQDNLGFQHFKELFGWHLEEIHVLADWERAG